MGLELRNNQYLPLFFGGNQYWFAAAAWHVIAPAHRP